MNYLEARRQACALELLKMGAVIPAQAIAISKMADAPVSHAEAKSSLKRLKSLDTSSLTGEQARRGAAIGEVAAPVLSVAQRAISGDHLLGGRVRHALEDFHSIKPGGGGKLRALGRVGVSAARNLAGSAVTGAIAGGAMPTVRHEVEREAERGKLKRYVAQGGHSGNKSGS